MGEVVYLERETVGEASLVPRSMRQPGVDPVSQFVSFGAVLDNLLAKVEARMVENGITKP